MFQLKLVFKKKSFLISLLAATFLSVLSFVLSCVKFFGAELNAIPSAEKVFMWSSGQDVISVVLIYLFPVLCVLPFADSYITEKDSNILPVLLPKFGAKRFLFEKLLAVAVSAFAVVAVPLLLNYVLSVATFPTEVNTYSTLSADQSWFFSTRRINMLLFPKFYIEHPYLTNLSSILLTGLFCALMSAFVCELSVFFSRSRVLILALFFIINDLLVLSQNLIATEKISCYTPFYYTMLGNDESGKTLWFFLLIFVVPLALCALILPFCVKKIKKCWG